MNFGRFYNRFNRQDMGLDKLKVTEWHCKLQIECGKLEALHNTFVKQALLKFIEGDIIDRIPRFHNSSLFLAGHMHFCGKGGY